jgi:benzodiazapine receptor
VTAEPIPTPRPHQLLGLLGWVLITFVAAVLGAVASVSAREFYAELARPTWAPPGWLFGPMWTCLYVLMAIAAWLVWRGRGFAGARTALTLFLIQLAANALWSWLFFRWRQGGLAFAEVLVLLVLVVATLVAFRRVSVLDLANESRADLSFRAHG